MNSKKKKILSAKITKNNYTLKSVKRNRTNNSLKKNKMVSLIGGNQVGGEVGTSYSYFHGPWGQWIKGSPYKYIKNTNTEVGQPSPEIMGGKFLPPIYPPFEPDPGLIFYYPNAIRPIINNKSNELEQADRPNIHKSIRLDYNPSFNGIGNYMKGKEGKNQDWPGPTTKNGSIYWDTGKEWTFDRLHRNQKKNIKKHFADARTPKEQGSRGPSPLKVYPKEYTISGLLTGQSNGDTTKLLGYYGGNLIDIYREQLWRKKNYHNKSSFGFQARGVNTNREKIGIGENHIIIRICDKYNAYYKILQTFYESLLEIVTEPVKEALKTEFPKKSWKPTSQCTQHISVLEKRCNYILFDCINKNNNIGIKKWLTKYYVAFVTNDDPVTKYIRDETETIKGVENMGLSPTNSINIKDTLINNSGNVNTKGNYNISKKFSAFNTIGHLKYFRQVNNYCSYNANTWNVRDTGGDDQVTFNGGMKKAGSIFKKDGTVSTHQGLCDNVKPDDENHTWGINGKLYKGWQRSYLFCPPLFNIMKFIINNNNDNDNKIDTNKLFITLKENIDYINEIRHILNWEYNFIEINDKQNLFQKSRYNLKFYDGKEKDYSNKNIFENFPNFESEEINISHINQWNINSNVKLKVNEHQLRSSGELGSAHTILTAAAAAAVPSQSQRPPAIHSADGRAPPLRSSVGLGSAPTSQATNPYDPANSHHSADGAPPLRSSVGLGSAPASQATNPYDPANSHHSADGGAATPPPAAAAGAGGVMTGTNTEILNKASLAIVFSESADDKDITKYVEELLDKTFGSMIQKFEQKMNYIKKQP